MSINEANFPSSLWDGLSDRRESRRQDAGPDYEDWDQMVAEVLAVQDYLIGAQTSSGFGAAAGTGVTADTTRGTLNVTTIDIAALSVTTTDNGAAGAQGSQKIYDFPAGNILILGAVGLLSISRVGTNLTATSAVVASVGTVAAGAGDATLTSTEANIVPSTTATLSGGANAAVDMASTAQGIFDGTATPADAILNFATPDAGSTGNDALLVSGSITITWVNLGDN